MTLCCYLEWHCVAVTLCCCLEWHCVAVTLCCCLEWHCVAVTLCCCLEWHCLAVTLCCCLKWHCVAVTLCCWLEWHCVALHNFLTQTGERSKSCHREYEKLCLCCVFWTGFFFLLLHREKHSHVFSSALDKDVYVAVLNAGVYMTVVFQRLSISGTVARPRWDHTDLTPYSDLWS